MFGRLYVAIFERFDLNAIHLNNFKFNVVMFQTRLHFTPSTNRSDVLWRASRPPQTHSLLPIAANINTPGAWHLTL